MALQLGVGNTCGLVASNLYLTTEAPRYLLGRTSTLSALASETVYTHAIAGTAVSYRRTCHHVPWDWAHYYSCRRLALPASQLQEEEGIRGNSYALQPRRVTRHG